MIHHGTLGKATYTAKYVSDCQGGKVHITTPSITAVYIPADLVLQVAPEIQARRVLADLEAKR